MSVQWTREKECRVVSTIYVTTITRAMTMKSRMNGLRNKLIARSWWESTLNEVNPYSLKFLEMNSFDEWHKNSFSRIFLLFPFKFCREINFFIYFKNIVFICLFNYYSINEINMKWNIWFIVKWDSVRIFNYNR